MTEENAFFQQEGTKMEDFLAEQEIDTPAESQPESNTEEEKPSQDGDNSPDETEDEPQEEAKSEEQVPFHEHPRWKERETDWQKRLDAALAEQERKFQEQIEQVKPQSKEETTIDPNLVPLIGDDPHVHKLWHDMRQKEREQIVQEAQERLLQKQTQEREASQKWEQWVDSEVSKLESEGKKFDRNELMKIAVDYKPTDDQGNISFAKALQILEATKPQKSEKAKARKEIAEQVSGDIQGEPEESKVVTSKDLRNKSWY